MRVSSVSMVGNYNSNYNLKTQNKKVLNQSVDVPVEKSETSFKGKAFGMFLRAVTAPAWVVGIAYLGVLKSITDGEKFSEVFAEDVKDVITGNCDDTEMNNMDADDFFRYMHSKDL